MLSIMFDGVLNRWVAPLVSTVIASALDPPVEVDSNSGCGLNHFEWPALQTECFAPEKGNFQPRLDPPTSWDIDRWVAPLVSTVIASAAAIMFDHHF